MKFNRICSMLAARRCFDSGATVAHLAERAGVSASTIRRWLRATGLRTTRRNA